MAKVLVLYYSSYGHIERMALAEADGARGAGAEVDIKRVPELVPAQGRSRLALQARPDRAVRADRRSRQLRRHRLRDTDAVR